MNDLLVVLLGMGVVWGLVRLTILIHHRLKLWIVLRNIKNKLKEQGIHTTFSVDLSYDREIRKIQYGTR